MVLYQKQGPTAVGGLYMEVADTAETTSETSPEIFIYNPILVHHLQECLRVQDDITLLPHLARNQ